MKPGEYPKNDKLAERLGELIGTEVPSSALDIARNLRESGTVEIAKGAVCKVSYRDNLREGTIVLTVRTREKIEIIRSKEFNTTMAPEDVDQVSAYFHVLPIHAFKSAIEAVLVEK